MPDFSWAIEHGEMVAVVAVLCCFNPMALLCLAIVTLNWLACCAYVLVSGDYNPKAARFFLDWSAGIALLLTRGGKWRGALALIYGTQLAAHIGFFLSQSANPDAYNGFLSASSRLQLLMIGGWGIVDLWRRAVRYCDMALIFPRWLGGKRVVRERRDA